MLSHCLLLFAHKWNCHNSKFDSCCAYSSGEIRVLHIAHCASASLGLPTQFVHCCLVTARAFMPASLIVIPYTILEISKFFGQLPSGLPLTTTTMTTKNLEPGYSLASLGIICRTSFHTFWRWRNSRGPRADCNIFVQLGSQLAPG